MFDPASKARLTLHDLGRFPDDTLFHRIARAVCAAGCLPRKELYEAWEVARRVRRRLRGGRVVDLCAGHGLLGQIMLLLDPSSSEALIVDRRLPLSAANLHAALARGWPALADRVSFREAAQHEITLDRGDVIVSVHACGRLTDEALALAQAARARVAVLPCCHDLDSADTGALTGWLDGPLAADVVRATTLKAAGWQVWTQTLPPGITPHRRLLMAAPAAEGASGVPPLSPA